jgi:hypothetical protein
LEPDFPSYEGMSRRLRYVPEGGALVEVTCRTIHSRFLLRPSPELNEIVVGVLGRAQQKYPIRCCAYLFISNHFHLLLDVDDAHQLALFMGYLNSNLAKELGLLIGWRDKVWARRYQSIVISNEDAAQTGRLKYILAHGVKEDLVERVSQWPGAHCARALVEGAPVEGYWFDRSQEYAARQRRQDFDRLCYATRETLILSPLPCWKHLTVEARRRPDRRDRSGSRRSAPGRGTPGSGSRRHPQAAPLPSSQAFEEVSSAVVPCREPGGAQGALRGLRVVRGRVCRRLREVAGWGSHGRVPDRELPAGAPLRGRVASGGGSFPAGSSAPERSGSESSGKRCIRQADELERSESAAPIRDPRRSFLGGNRLHKGTTRAKTSLILEMDGGCPAALR